MEPESHKWVFQVQVKFVRDFHFLCFLCLAAVFPNKAFPFTENILVQKFCGFLSFFCFCRSKKKHVQNLSFPFFFVKKVFFFKQKSLKKKEKERSSKIFFTIVHTFSNQKRNKDKLVSSLMDPRKHVKQKQKKDKPQLRFPLRST